MCILNIVRPLTLLKNKGQQKKAEALPAPAPAPGAAKDGPKRPPEEEGVTESVFELLGDGLFPTAEMVKASVDGAFLHKLRERCGGPMGGSCSPFGLEVRSTSNFNETYLHCRRQYDREGAFRIFVKNQELYKLRRRVLNDSGSLRSREHAQQ